MDYIFGYVDHNILDSIRKGDPYDIKGFLRRSGIIPVYSVQNIQEIRRSIGSESEFLKVLESIGGHFLTPLYEGGFLNGKGKVFDDSVFDVWEWHQNNSENKSDYGYGLSAMLQKMYGGRVDESYDKIFEKGVDEIEELILSSLDEPGIRGLLEPKDIAAAEDVPRLLRGMLKNASAFLDAQDEVPVKSFELASGLGAKVLNNINPPNVVEKIFDRIQEKIPGQTLESFFGLASNPHDISLSRELSMAEKVNSIYHQLNFIGYNRDSKMKTSKGFVRSASDMTHAGMATYCHVFLCRDKGLVKKASAAYEYLGVGTKILYFS